MSDNNQEPIKPDEILPMIPPDQNLQVDKKSNGIFIGTLNLMANPAKKLIIHPLKRRYHRHYHSRHRYGKYHLVADIILLSTVIVLSIITGMSLWSNWRTSLSSMELKITTEATELTTGLPTTFTIHWKNNNEYTLENSNLALKLPKHFELLSVNPTTGWNSQLNTWALGKIDPNLTNTLEFKGVLWSAPQQNQNIIINFTGTNPDNEKEIASFTDTVATQKIALEVKPKIPSTVILKQPNTIEWIITNNSLVPFNNLSAKFKAPDEWKPLSTQPAALNNIWNIPQVAAGGQVSLTQQGVFDLLPSNPSFTLNLIINNNGDLIPLLDSRADTTILDPALEVTSHIIQPKGAANPGDHIVVALDFHNRGDFSLEDLSISATIKGPYLATNSIRATNGRIKDKIINWDKTTQSILADVAPDQSGEMQLEFDTATTTDLSTLSPLDNLSIIIEPTAQFKVPILPTQTINWTGSASYLAINSQLNLAAQARYFTPEGEQVGRGPIPPRVGKETKYWVAINLTNTIHDVYETVVTITLPTGVTYANNTSVTAGDALQYSPQTNKIQWTIGRLDHFLGNTPPIVIANLELAVKPTANNLGQEIILIESAKVRGIDVSTKNEVTATTPAITTDLVNDALARGKGRVQP